MPGADPALTVPPAIRAAVDRIMPADLWPGGWDGGVSAHLATGAHELDWARRR
ncbi:MAG TPA: hypothetical protein VFH64_08000 [Amnibacterium sp.]|nr:hypothetical protein [Amnibacterium sp.]